MKNRPQDNEENFNNQTFKSFSVGLVLPQDHIQYFYTFNILIINTINIASGLMYN